MSLFPEIEIREAHDGDGEALAGLSGSVFAEYGAGIVFLCAEFIELDSVASYFRHRGGRPRLAEEEGRLPGMRAIHDASRILEFGYRLPAIAPATP